MNREKSLITSPVLRLLKAKEAAEALAISERKLWTMTDEGEIPHIRLGRSVRYPVAELQRWIEENQKGGDAE